MRIDGFAIAIRFNKSFSIADNFGAILDRLLYESDESFNNKIYQEFDSYLDARVLKDKEGKNKLTINSENFILDLSEIENFEKVFYQYVSAFQTTIAEKLFNQYDIHKINRFGCVFKVQLDESDIIIKTVEEILVANSSNPESLSLRYNCSHKKPKVIKGTITEDYENEIVTYVRDKRDSPMFLLKDYQYYFKPPLMKIQDSKTSFQTFCLTRYEKFQKEYLKK